MLPYLETEAPSPDEIPFFVLPVVLFHLSVLPKYVPPFSYLLPLLALSMLTDFMAFAPFCIPHAAVLFPISGKPHPVTCVWSYQTRYPVLIWTQHSSFQWLSTGKNLCLMSNLKLFGSSFWLLDLIILFSSWLKSWICFPHENTCPCNQVPSQSSFWWAKQIELSKSLPAGNFLHSSNQYCGYFLDSSFVKSFFSCWHQNRP